MKLRRTVNSFDCFDTLIARRCGTAAQLFGEVERSTGAKGFAAARVAAESALIAGGIAHDLHAIYRRLVADGKCDAPAASRLLAAEVAAEFDNVVPIVANLRRVRAGDIVVSDMYLNAEMIRRLLARAGLRVPVDIHVSNAGKRSGEIWPALIDRYLILRHLGDNDVADIAAPARHGIATEHCKLAVIGAAERFLAGNGYPVLAGVVRAARLACPFPETCAEAGFWNAACELNFPLLCLYARVVVAGLQATGKERVLFCARDGLFLSEIFSALYPEFDSDYLHVSRPVLRDGEATARDYLLAQRPDAALVCELASTGASWHAFASREGVRVELLTLVNIDQLPVVGFDRASLVGSPRLGFGWHLRASELEIMSSALEVMNTAPCGTTLGIARDAAGFRPLRAERHELPDHVVTTLVAAQDAAMKSLWPLRPRLLDELAKPPEPMLARTLVQSISASALLNAVAELVPAAT